MRRNHPIALLLIALTLGGCASSAAPESASRVITCTAGAQCEQRWSRAMQWLQQNSSWKVTTATDMLLTTEGPLTTEKPAFEVTKAEKDNGRSFQITMRAWCGAGDCAALIERLHADFYSYVTAK